MKSILNLAAVISLTAIGSLAIAAPAKHSGYTGQKLAAIALKAHPGRITDQELENEGGGSGLRYSFDIVSGGKTFEVGVDAASGAVLENKVEGKNPD
jgi:hypothetical protein